MSLAKSSFSMTRYKLMGGRKKIGLSDLNQMVLSRQAKNIKITGVYKDLNYGWVRPIELADESVAESRNWDMSDCRVADGYLLRLRIEKRKVPSGLMQLVLRERIMQRESKRENPLSRSEKREIKEQVKVELTEHCLPTLTYVDAYWNDEKKHLILFSTSKAQQDLFEEIFRDSFLTPLKMSMIRVLPPILGLVDDEGEGSQTGEVYPYSKITLATPSLMT